jgi:hypothetical protein
MLLVEVVVDECRFVIVMTMVIGIMSETIGCLLNSRE